MRITIGITLLLTLGMSQFAVANSTVPITAVVLYPGNATVERAVHVTAGMTKLALNGLPANFDMQTIRVQADPGISIGQVVTQEIGHVTAMSAREAELEAKIQSLEDKQAALDAETKSSALVQHYLEGLNGVGAVSTDRAQPYIDAKSMATVIETIRRSASDSFDRMQKIVIQKRDIGESIKALQRDLERVRSGTKDVRNITINLAVHQAGIVKFSYQVNGAGWKPGYRAALDSVLSNMELERLATISQNTGEDWNGVKLKLSTGQPRLSPAAPEPYPWKLTYYKPTGTRNDSLALLGVVAAPAPMAKNRLKQSSVADNYEPPVLQVENTFATEFEVPLTVTLPADGREVAVTLSKQSMPVKQRVRVAPRIDMVAFVTAEADRPEGVWLSSDIQLYRDGSYVGATNWNPQASERFVFPFGRDDLVRVSVGHAHQKSGTAGFLSQRNERHIVDVYTVTSHHKTPIELLVLESSPVSTSDEIKVQTTFLPKPTTENWEQRQGVAAWEKVIAPNETMKISVNYDMTYPKDGHVAGMP
jgi:uncharacterized protein (TIGR02231 family)